jgi:long-chain fatty acid transport protein
MKTLSRLLLIAVMALGLTTGLFANGLNLNSNGSKAAAMGGAFVGLADDFSAVFWNPAGLAQMTKASFSLYCADIIPFGTYTFAPAGVDTKTVLKHNFAPAAGYFQPIGDRIVVGLYVYAPSGLGATWDGEDLSNLSGGNALDWHSKLGVFTASPSIAVKVTDQIMIGASLNVNYGMLKMARPAATIYQYSEDLKGFAVGGTFGLLVKPVKQFSFGVTYKLPFTAKLKGDADFPLAAAYSLPTTDTGTRTAAWPGWLAAGVAIKPMDRLTITADVQYTNWKKLQTIPIVYENEGWQAAFAPSSAYTLLWKDCTQIRAGLEYMVTDSFAVRGGYYYDPNPTPKSTQNILLPEHKYNWVTFGLGYKSSSLVLEASVEYGMGDDIDVSMAEVIKNVGMPGIHGLNIVAPTVSLTYKF